MAVSSGTSFILASISAVLLFSGMQMYKPWLISSQIHTILGGYLGSVLFIFAITACGNFETIVFGKNKQVKLFPEVMVCLFGAFMSAGTIHRVSATTCLLFSITSLYFINKYSQKMYAVTTAPAAVPVERKKRK